MPDQRSATISVSGEAETRRAAERATVHLTIGFEGRDRAEVLPPTHGLHREVSAALDAMRHEPDGPVTWWASDQIRVWAQRPWHDQGTQLPLVHHTAVTVRATFSDFARLGDWVGELASHEGVSVDQIVWTLTERTRTDLTADVRRRAVLDAQDKAATYARAAGFDRVRPVAIGDPGLLQGATAPGPSPAMFGARAAVSRGGPESGGIEFTPDEITISAEVHARFAAE